MYTTRADFATSPVFMEGGSSCLLDLFFARYPLGWIMVARTWHACGVDVTDFDNRMRPLSFHTYIHTCKVYHSKYQMLCPKYSGLDEQMPLITFLIVPITPIHVSPLPPSPAGGGRHLPRGGGGHAPPESPVAAPAGHRRPPRGGAQVAPHSLLCPSPVLPSAVEGLRQTLANGYSNPQHRRVDQRRP